MLSFFPRQGWCHYHMTAASKPFCRHLLSSQNLSPHASAVPMHSRGATFKGTALYYRHPLPPPPKNSGLQEKYRAFWQELKDIWFKCSIPGCGTEQSRALELWKTATCFYCRPHSTMLLIHAWLCTRPQIPFLSTTAVPNKSPARDPFLSPQYTPSAPIDVNVTCDSDDIHKFKGQPLPLQSFSISKH